MAAPRQQAESRGPSAPLFWMVLGVMITASGTMLSTVYFVVQTYAENITSNQALSKEITALHQRINGTEATLFSRINTLEGNIIDARNEILAARNEIVGMRMEFRKINEGIIARLDALNVEGRTIEGGAGDGLSVGPSTPGEGNFQINGTPPVLRDTERGS